MVGDAHIVVEPGHDPWDIQLVVLFEKPRLAFFDEGLSGFGHFEF